MLLNLFCALIVCVALASDPAVTGTIQPVVNHVSTPSNSSDSNGGDADSVPQWETAVFALIGCFGAIGCMLGLKGCTKCYGRARRSWCPSEDEEEVDEPEQTMLRPISRKSTSKGRSSSKPKKGKSFTETKSTRHSRADRDDEY